MSDKSGSDLPTLFRSDAVGDDRTLNDDNASQGQEIRQRIKLSPRAEEAAGQFSKNGISPNVVANALRLIDFCAVFVLAALINFAYVMPIDGYHPRYFAVAGLASLLTIIAAQSARAYDVTALRHNTSQLARILGAWSIVFAALIVGAFFSGLSEEFSRVWFASWYLSGFTFFAIYRSLVSGQVRRWGAQGRLERRAIIVGGGEQGATLIRALETQQDSDIRICGVFDDRSDERSPAMVAGYPKLGTISELVEFGRRTRIDMLIVSLPMTAENRVLQLLKKIWILPVDIRLSAHGNKLRFRPRSYSYVGTVPFLDVFDKPIADWDSVMKRAFDIAFATLGIIVFSPLMIGAALAVKLTSKGPIIFRQKRFGFKNEVIEVMKFRSMFVEHSDPEAKLAVTKGDARVTKVGRFIRRTSIDELPQLFNVLSGELSLVGPRPHAINAHTQEKLWDDVIDGYFGRHRVKPGVTGWAQINGWRGEVDTEEKIRRRVEHDLYYIENWSVLFDLYICLATPLKLLKGENAF